REKPHHHPENDDGPFKRPDDPKGTRSDILKGPPPPGSTTQTTPRQPKTVPPRPLQTLQHSSGPWRHDSRASAPTTTFDQENSRRQLDNDALVAPTPRQKSPPTPNPAPTPEYGPHHRSLQKSRQCLSPLPPPHLQQSPGRSRTRTKSSLDPAASPREPHSSASPQPTSPPPQQP
ncbi:hypothetical protein C0989_011902, partial [Termitomyces sp. Mn162]